MKRSRTLGALERVGVALCGEPGHHHHLICRSCGLTVEIAANDVEQWAQRTAAMHGFSEAEHVVDIFGLCASCAQARASERVVD